MKNALIVAVVVAALALVGWYFWNRNKKKTEDPGYNLPGIGDTNGNTGIGGGIGVGASGPAPAVGITPQILIKYPKSREFITPTVISPGQLGSLFVNATNMQTNNPTAGPVVNNTVGAGTKLGVTATLGKKLFGVVTN